MPPDNPPMNSLPTIHHAPACHVQVRLGARLRMVWRFAYGGPES